MVQRVLKSYSTVSRILAVAGPGLVTMLADTDAGSIVTAAQSGAQWGYRLVALQALLIPILFMVQELSVRLGVVSGEGHGALIARTFGRGWAWVSVGTLLLACLGAVVSEFSGLAGAGLLFGVPKSATLGMIVTALSVMAFVGSYRSVERIAFGLGLFELVFIIVAWQAHPTGAQVWQNSLDWPLRDRGFLYLVAGNIGAVLMPWMVFYQQSSVVEKGLTPNDLTLARWDTALGALITQLIMIAVVIAAAAALYRANAPVSLETVQQISGALSPVLGAAAGRILLGLGILGAALVATIVVTLTAARALGELLGVPHSLAHSAQEAPWFYGTYVATLLAGALIVGSDLNLVRLSVAVQVGNALLLPIVLGFLYLLARRLPAPYRLHGFYGAAVALVIGGTAAVGVYAALAGS